MLGAATSSDLIGGVDLLRLLVLAVGGALVVGNVLALLRPPVQRTAGTTDQDRLTKPPIARSLVMIGVGLIATIWALASLTA